MSEPNYPVAAAVVLYNPTDDVFENINSYHQQVEFLYIIDNSDRYNAGLIKRLEGLGRVKYVNNLGNRGVAAALNVGAKMGIADGYAFLLTMDQDTLLPPDFVIALFSKVKSDQLDKTGIIAPRFSGKVAENTDAQNILFTMTSATLLNLEIYSKVGPFLDDLFIDHVDHEYALRLNDRGYSVIQINALKVLHRPGNLVQFSFFGKTHHLSSHSPDRLYYFIRNGFFVSKLYQKKFPVFRKLFLRLVAKEVLKILVDKDKLLRVRMIFKGIKDYKYKKLGPLHRKLK